LKVTGEKKDLEQTSVREIMSLSPVRIPIDN